MQDLNSGPATALPAIRVENVSAGYEDIPILENISFDVQQGERFVILGGSGCGKSTLLKVLIGLLSPMTGTIHLNGQLITGDVLTLQKILRKVGILYQSGALFGSMTLAENVALPIRTYTPLPAAQVNLLVRMKLAQVKLEGYENYLPSEISGGMKKRAALARALALNPQILFFDEPSAGLDPISSAELDNLILHINETLGTTMVIVTHELESIYKIAQRVIMLDKKTKGIIAAGIPSYLREHHESKFVRNFFNRQADDLFS